MKKTYIIKFVKTGREWKNFIDGVDFLNDNERYRLEWKLEGLWTAIRGWWSIVTKCPGIFMNGWYETK